MNSKEYVTRGAGRPGWVAGLIAVTFFCLAAIYGIVNPIFESPDELWHYPYVWHVAQTGQLPVQDPNQRQLWEHEGSQAPLYYMLAALLTAGIDSSDLPSLLYLNPHADIGLVTPDGNANIVVHTEREAWPWQGATLAIHLARLFSALLGTGTLLAIYKLGRFLWPDRPGFALLAMAFVAFNPMFIFIAGSINNDNMITLTATLTLWQLIVLIASDPRQPIPLRRYGVVGILAGLAALSKLSGLGMVGLVGLSLLGLGLYRRSWRPALLGNSIVVGAVGLVAGWWYLRNIALYGDWTGTQSILSLMSPRSYTPNLAQWALEFSGLLRSFWGVFGYFSILMPPLIYWALNLLLAVGLVGLAGLLWPGRFRALPPRLRRAWPALAIWIGVMVASLIWYTWQIPSSQGRLLFPAIGAMAVMWAVGWTLLIPRRWHLLPALVMLPVAAWIPGGLIAPAYALPEPLAQLPARAEPLEIRFGDVATLRGYELLEPSLEPGGDLYVRLYWQSEQPTEIDYTLFLHLVDEKGVLIAQRDLFPGPGVYPTSQWRRDTLFGDTYTIRLPSSLFAPVDAHLFVGLYDGRTGERLPTDAGDDRVRFGQVQIHPRPGPLPNPQQLVFDDGIHLIGFDLDRRRLHPGDELTLNLYWQAQRIPSRNYKVFVHVVNEEGVRVAQHDSEPQRGAQPTSAWQTGAVIEDTHPLHIAGEAPPGTYDLIVGLYDGESGERLFLLSDNGALTQVSAVTLGRMRVLP